MFTLALRAGYQTCVGQGALSTSAEALLDITFRFHSGSSGGSMNDNDKTSRGEMLRKVAMAPIAIGAFAALQQSAQAAPNMTQKAASYQDKPNAGKQCDGCSLFIPGKTKTANGTCKLVQGSISPHGWCKFYSPKAK